MFLIALNKKLRDINWFKKNNINEPKLINFLDLVTLGTVCDVVPLIGINRAIIRQGLKKFKEISDPGLKALKNICGIESNLNLSFRLCFRTKNKCWGKGGQMFSWS